MTPALLLAAALAAAAALYTALRGPRTAAEAEPGLHPDSGAAPEPTERRDAPVR